MAPPLMQLLLLTATALGLVMPGSTAARLFGKYMALVEKQYPCEDGASSNKIIMSLTFTRQDRQQPWLLSNMTGKIIVDGIPGVDDNMAGSIRLDSRSNSDWKPNAIFFNFPTKICSAIMEHAPDFARVAFGSHIPSQKPCFIPKGTYAFADQPINLTFPKFPVLPYGHYRGRLELGHKAERLMCMYVESRIIPQPKRNRRSS